MRPQGDAIRSAEVYRYSGQKHLSGKLVVSEKNK